MSDSVPANGLHFDELNKLRVIDPDVANTTIILKTESSEFVESIASFKNIVDSFVKIINTVAQQVEKEKLRAIGARNLVQSMSKQREAQQQQLQALLIEKTTNLERLKVQYQSLMKTESEQLDMIDRLLLSN